MAYNMITWTPISTEKHRDKRWTPRETFSSEGKTQIVEIFASELAYATHNFPLGFVIKDSRYILVALLGIHEEENLYVDKDGRWLSEYVPSSLRCFPFILSDGGPENDQLTVCIAKDHLTDDVNGLNLFDEKGEQSESLTNAVSYLQKCQQDRELTASTTLALEEAGIIEKWPIQIVGDENTTATNIDGLFRINEAKLNSLESAKFSELRNTGSIALAYAQLFSMTQVQLLTARQQYISAQSIRKN